LKRIEDEIAVQEKNSLFKHGLASPTRLSKNENYLYRKTLLEKTTELLYTLPIHMLSRNTKFHSPHFAEAFSTIQQDVLSKFNEFGHEEGARLLASTQRKAFVNARYALSLAKAFSARYSLPLPKNISINRNQRNWQKQPN
jgi:hypothetical protein